MDILLGQSRGIAKEAAGDKKLCRRRRSVSFVKRAWVALALLALLLSAVCAVGAC